MRRDHHRPAPDHRRLLVHEEAHGHDLHAVFLDGLQDVVAGKLGPVLDREQARQRGAVDVGVEHANAQAVLLEAQRQVDGGGGFADAAFARSDRDNVLNPADAACLRTVRVRRAALLGIGGQRDDGARDARQRLHRVLGGLAHRLVGVRLRPRNAQRKINLILADYDFRQTPRGDEIGAARLPDGSQRVHIVFICQGMSHICASCKG